MIPLHGHNAAVTAFREGRASGRLHHAWLLAGPRGVGKATFAHKAAAWLLAEAAGPPIGTEDLETPPEHPVARLLAAYSHPDFRLLDRLPADKKRRPLPRIDWEDDEPLARNINIEQVRALASLFTSTPSMSPWRAVVIDSIDDLERASANALLKMLEEPPPLTLFLLVSHSPANLLPTIRSRCQTVRFEPLDDAVMTSALGALAPDAAPGEIAQLVAGGEGAPGVALARRGLNVAALDADLDRIAATGDPDNRIRAALSGTLALKAAQPRYEMFLARAPRRIAATARARQGPALAEALALWERARDLAATAVPLSLDPATVTFELAGYVAGLAPRHHKRS